jgi:pyruvate/2-oxoglutarate dehydrogenase complex dihydrolipoamide acyltransferase (E2) component
LLSGLSGRGDSVRRGEVVVVVETEKAAVEIPSDVNGKNYKNTP